MSSRTFGEILKAGLHKPKRFFVASETQKLNGDFLRQSLNQTRTFTCLDHNKTTSYRRKLYLRDYTPLGKLQLYPDAE